MPVATAWCLKAQRPFLPKGPCVLAWLLGASWPGWGGWKSANTHQPLPGHCASGDLCVQSPLQCAKPVHVRSLLAGLLIMGWLGSVPPPLLVRTRLRDGKQLAWVTQSGSRSWAWR